ncbi:MAG: integrase arm-type DNA-binding domain-containing protein [Amphiplicatus sp.]
MLTDVKCRTAKPRAKRYKLADGGGLYLEVLPSGNRSWRFRYRLAGRQKVLVIGLYPAVSLAAARRARDEAKRQLMEGVDPAEQKRLERLAEAVRRATTFKAVASELIAKRAREGAAEATLTKLRWLLLDLAAPLADRPVAEITTPELLAVLRKVEARGRLESARRLRSACGRVFRHAVATGRAERDPAADLKDALAAPVATHRAAITRPDEIGALVRAISGYEGAPEIRLAMKFALLTAARPGEARRAEWGELDIEGATWTIPAQKMKMRRPHRVPLSAQALAVIEELRPLTGGGRYLFPSVRTRLRPISEGSMNAALRRMGYSKETVCAHGFRSMFSTWANESGLWDADVIEAALAHQDANAVRRAYNRAERWDERERLMQWWADELDRLAAGRPEKVVPLARGAAAS